MAECIFCHEKVTAGFVLCGDCATEPMALAYFIDRLAEDIVQDERIPMCGMCAIGHCGSQVSGMTCRNGVKTWLLNKAKRYAAQQETREAEYFAFLNKTVQPEADEYQAKRRLEARFPQLKRRVDGADALVRAWKASRKIAG